MKNESSQCVGSRSSHDACGLNNSNTDTFLIRAVLHCIVGYSSNNRGIETSPVYLDSRLAFLDCGSHSPGG